MPPTQKPVVATQTVIVHDDNLNIDRKVIAGQPVPPDLVAAYRDKVGDGAEADPADVDPEAPHSPPPDPTAEIAGDYEDATADALEREVARRRAVGRELDVEGSGSGGNVVKSDLIAALEDDDERGDA